MPPPNAHELACDGKAQNGSSVVLVGWPGCVASVTTGEVTLQP